MSPNANLTIMDETARPIRTEKWITRRWTTDQRYYVVEIQQDLFGIWLVKRSWGGIGSRRGNSLTIPADSYEHALLLLAEVKKRRRTRGYQAME